MASENGKMVEEIKQAEYLKEICKETPHVVIGTQCGVGKYKFRSISYRNQELVLEFSLIRDDKYSDSENIFYNIGDRCILTASQYLFAYDYNACA